MVYCHVGYNAGIGVSFGVFHTRVSEMERGCDVLVSDVRRNKAKEIGENKEFKIVLTFNI
jgi:hypothetical protein